MLRKDVKLIVLTIAVRYSSNHQLNSKPQQFLYLYLTMLSKGNSSGQKEQRYGDMDNPVYTWQQN